MQTVIINIINNKAVRLLQDLELLQFIRMRGEKTQPTTVIDWLQNTKEQ